MTVHYLSIKCPRFIKFVACPKSVQMSVQIGGQLFCFFFSGGFFIGWRMTKKPK